MDEVEQFRSQRCRGARRRLLAGFAVQDADAFDAKQFSVDHGVEELQKSVSGGVPVYPVSSRFTRFPRHTRSKDAGADAEASGVESMRQHRTTLTGYGMLGKP
jgi:hypothetical protein